MKFDHTCTWCGDKKHSCQNTLQSCVCSWRIKKFAEDQKICREAAKEQLAAIAETLDVHD